MGLLWDAQYRHWAPPGILFLMGQAYSECLEVHPQSHPFGRLKYGWGAPQPRQIHGKKRSYGDALGYSIVALGVPHGLLFVVVRTYFECLDVPPNSKFRGPSGLSVVGVEGLPPHNHENNRAGTCPPHLLHLHNGANWNPSCYGHL